METERPPVDRYQLERFLRDWHLSPQSFDELARKAHVEKVPAGRRLVLRGKFDNWTLFLVSGRLQLDWGNGRLDTQVAGFDAEGPIAHGQPRPATVTALTPVEYIRIDNNLLDVLSRPEGAGGAQLEEITADAVDPANRLFHALYHDYMSDRLQLPHLPDVAIRVRAAAEDPESDILSIAHIVQADPVLTARLIQVANSPIYGPSTPIQGLRSAVSFLGMESTRDLVLRFALRQLFTTRSPLLQKRMQTLWNHGTLVSAVSHVMGDATPGIDADRAMVAGLLHDVGALPVINYASRFPEITSDSHHLEEAINALKAQMGAMMLRQWKFGDEMVRCVLECENWSRDPAPRADLCDVVMISQVIAGEIPPELLPAAPEELPAWRRLVRGRLDHELAQEMVQEARTEVADVLALLH